MAKARDVLLRLTGDPSSAKRALDDIKGDLKSFDAIKAEARADIKTAGAKAELEKFEARLARLDKQTVTPAVTVARAKAVADIERIEKKLAGIKDQTVTVKVKQEGDDPGSGGRSGISGALGSVGGKSAVGAVAVATLGKSVDGAIGREDVGAQLAGQLGLVGKDAERAGREAGKLYADGYGASVAEVGDAIRALVQNVGLDVSGGNVQDFAAKLLNLTRSFETDADQLTKTINSLVSNGLAANVDEAFDLITSGFQNGADRGGEFLDTLNEYAEPFKSVGLSAQDMASSITRGFDAGVFSADKLGDSLKEFSIRAVDGSQATRDAYKDLGLDADDLTKKIASGGPAARDAFGEVIDAVTGLRDPVRRERNGVALFGATFEDVGSKGVEALRPVARGFRNVRGSAKQLDTTLNETSGQTVERFKRSVTRVMTDAGAAVIRFAEKIKDGIPGAFRSIRRFLSNFPDTVKSGAERAGRAIGNGVKAGMRAALEGLKGIAAGYVNGLIGVVNLGIDQVNKALGPRDLGPLGTSPDLRIGNIAPVKFARGGVVPGFGSGDTVPGLLTPGEFVFQKSAVDAIGVGNLAAMNAGRGAGQNITVNAPITVPGGGPPDPRVLGVALTRELARRP